MLYDPFYSYRVNYFALLNDQPYCLGSDSKNNNAMVELLTFWIGKKPLFLTPRDIP